LRVTLKVKSAFNHPQNIVLMSEKIHPVDFAEQARNSYRAKPYLFKKKIPQAGEYPQNYSPYRLASIHALNNAVKITPAEVFSDFKLLRQGFLQEFSSQYFEEGGLCDMEDHTKKCFKSHTSSFGQRRVSSSRHFSRREPFAQGLPVPQSLAEERKQLKAAMEASVSTLQCSPHIPRTLESHTIQGNEGHTERRTKVQRPVLRGALPCAKRGR
jgi:hypothetical protein